MPPDTNDGQHGTSVNMLALESLTVSWDKTTFTDANGDTINYETATNMSASMVTVDNNNLSFVINPPDNSFVGVYIVSVRGYDDYGAEKWQIITVNVNENHPPVLVRFNSLYCKVNLII